MIRLAVPASLVGPAGKRFKCSWNGQHECLVAGLLAGADGYQACWTEPSIAVAPSGWAFAVRAEFVDKILRGTKPGDILVEQPTKFDFIINVRGGAAPAWPTRVLITAMEEAQIIGTALIIRPSRALALPTDANASLGYAHASAVGGGRAISFASLRRFCAIAASMNSNRATPRSAQSQTTEPAEGHQTQAGTGA